MEDQLCLLPELEDLRHQIQECSLLDQENINIHALQEVSHVSFWNVTDGEIQDISALRAEKYFTSDSNDRLLHSSVLKQREILIVLESPHVNDYTYALESIYEMSPTLNVIYNYIETIFTRLIDLGTIKPNTIYAVKVIDSVPYMASLGEPQSKPENKSITYRIWQAIWSKLGYREKFIARIQSLPEGSVVINACTNSCFNSDNNVIIHPKKSIHDAVLNCNSNSPPRYFEIWHPSSCLYNKLGFINSIDEMA